MCHIPLGVNQTQIVTRESANLRLADWRKTEHLVTESLKLSRNATWVAQRDVLRNEHPCHLVFATTGASPNDRLAHQAKVEGYELCLNNLDAFSQPLKKSEKLVELFENPEPTTRKK